MAPFSYGDSTAFYATVRSYGQIMASARWCMMYNGITACSCSPRCRARSVNHCDYELDQRLLFYLQRRKTKARDLQDPEYPILYLPRYRGTLEGTVLSSCQRPRRRGGVRESISLISGSCLRYWNYSLKIRIHRLNLGNLNSFVFQSSNAKRPIDFWSLLIL